MLQSAPLQANPPTAHHALHTHSDSKRLRLLGYANTHEQRNCNKREHRTGAGESRLTWQRLQAFDQRCFGPLWLPHTPLTKPYLATSLTHNQGKAVYHHDAAIWTPGPPWRSYTESYKNLASIDNGTNRQAILQQQSNSNTTTLPLVSYNVVISQQATSKSASVFSQESADASAQSQEELFKLAHICKEVMTEKL